MKLLCRRFLFKECVLSAADIDGVEGSMVIVANGIPCEYSRKDILDRQIWRSLGIHDVSIRDNQNKNMQISFVIDMHSIRQFTYETVKDVSFNSQDEYDLWVSLK